MKTQEKRERRGAVAILVALALVVLLGFIALTVDLGYARLVGAQLQAGADAAALAGASRLDLRSSGLVNARAAAVEVGALNQANGVALALDANPGNEADGPVVLGVWSEDGTFTPNTDPTKVNAVQIIARDDTLTPLFSRAAFQRDELGAAALSIARRGLKLGAGQVPYYLPFGLADCLFDTWSRDELQDMTFVLNPDGADSTGWVGVGTRPTASWISEQLDLASVCMHEWVETGEVSSDCSAASVGDSVTLDNGEVAAGLQDLADTIASEGVPWDPSVWGALPARHPGSALSTADYGKVLLGPLPVFDGDPSYCAASGGKWTGDRPLVGFVWAALYDVKTKGAAGTKNVWLRIDVKHIYDVGDWWGGPDWGVVVTGPPVVVQ